MPDDFDAGRAASGLAEAWRSGQQHDALRALVRPRDLAEAYEIQDRLIDLLDHPVVGWKAGFAGSNIFRGAGLERPVFGRLLGPRSYASGDVITVPRDTEITVELEIALVIARDLDADTIVTPDLVRSAHLGIEVVSSRLPNRESIGVAATVADNVVSYAVVLGDAIDLLPVAAIAADMSVIADGETRARGLVGNDLPDPLRVLGHLIAHLGARGHRLKQGDVIFTGTITSPFAVLAPSELSGGGAGSFVRCRLEPAA